jgi:hypothetical protein
MNWRQWLLPILFVCALTGTASAQNAGTYIFPGQRLVSTGCSFKLLMQGDGNLVTYNNSNGSAWWASNTLNTGGYAVLQPDGNFVIYNWSDAPVWATGTAYGTGSRETIYQQNDGNLVIDGTGGLPIWASGAHTQPFYLGCPQSLSAMGEFTYVNYNRNLYGGDYKSIVLPTPRASWCGGYCAADSQCKAYTYVPPGVQQANAVCWLKSSVPAASSAPGLISGWKTVQGPGSGIASDRWPQ